ncbi:hypothetical protein BD779DRAFT_1670236 [Infundibulicybe gibba]|nr:hypothetical protein BD779DRAFT_1670236 [Infundibulicybe gibba]
MALRLARSLHITSRRSHLVGPPDPISHIRPIVYTDYATPSSSSVVPARIRHPYSLTEFDDSEHTVHSSTNTHELQFRLQRQQLDAYHHDFWLNSNTRFEAAKAAILAALPPGSTPLDKEQTLSQFYTQWYMQEAPRTDAYTTEWRKRNWALVALEMRVQYQRAVVKLGRLFSFGKEGL